MMSGKPSIALRALCLLFTCVGLTAFAQSAAFVQPGQTLAFERAAHLRRGVNLSSWYAEAPDYTPERLSTYTTPEDFRLIKSLGFDHVRLSINPEPLIADTTGLPEARIVTLNADAIARLDKSIADITATGLNVILDIHPDHPYAEMLSQGDQGVSSFLAFWKVFAAHYAGTDPTKVYFEILNEPVMADNARWASIQARAVAIIRPLAPHTTLIATGAQWGGIPGILALQPLHDDNILYSFHDYDPMVFTHQGASWAGPGLVTLRNVPYPSSPENVAPLVAHETDPKAKQVLTEYGQQHWDRQRMNDEIASVAAWAESTTSPFTAASSVSSRTSPIPPCAPAGSTTCATPSRPTTSAGTCGITRAASPSSSASTDIPASTALSPPRSASSSSPRTSLGSAA